MNASELTLESLARRVDELERRLAERQPPPVKDWRRVVGLFDDSEVMPKVIAEGQAIREADRPRRRSGVRRVILLDTDHLSVLQVPSSERRTRLVTRMSLAAGEDFGTTIVNVEEQMGGWLAAIAKEKQVRRHVAPYRELGRLFDFFRAFAIAEFDDRAADEFANLRSARIRIGTMDLKIAAIVIVNGAKLLTANRADFAQVPGLHFENWMD